MKYSMTTMQSNFAMKHYLMMIENILTINHHLIHKYHVEVIMKEKSLYHPPSICLHGQKFNTSRSGMSPLYRPYE